MINRENNSKHPRDKKLCKLSVHWVQKLLCPDQISLDSIEILNKWNQTSEGFLGEEYLEMELGVISMILETKLSQHNCCQKAERIQSKKKTIQSFGKVIAIVFWNVECT